MSDAILLLWPPLALALCLVAIHAYFGLQVLARGVVFVDLALAQIAALGATVAFMLGHPPQGAAALGYSLLFTVGAAFVLACVRRWSGRIPQEALIGVVYVVAAAAALLLVDKAPQGAEHIKQLLTGNILTSGLEELKYLAPLYAGVGALHWLCRRPLGQPGTGLSGWTWEFVFYATFGVVVTSSVAIAGVLLVFSFLIIPATIGTLFADTLARRLLVGWIAGGFASLVGLAASYAWDLPTGAAMICVLGAGLAISGLGKWLVAAPRAHLGRAADASRGLLALVLALSGLWLAAAPRADQPVLDGLERGFSWVRRGYMSPYEVGVYEDADRQTERYAAEAERLNALEARSRFADRRMDDEDVRRLSSFLRSYTEMRKGEDFVKREVRGRARERGRWTIGAVFLALAAAATPWRALRRGSRS